MPVPKRYFHCSQELNTDPEGWAFTARFGDRALRTLLQVLVILDRSGNRWRLSGDWLATLARMVRQSVANVSRQIEWMIAIGWLRVLEEAADGSPLILEAPNWWKYNRRQEHKGNTSVPDAGVGKAPLPSSPTPTPTPSHSLPTPKIEEKKRKDKRGDAASPSAMSRLESFSVTAELEAWAQGEGITNPSLELDEFKDYWRSVGGKRAGGKVITDWDATFRNRLRELKAANKLKTSSVWGA